MSSSYKILQDYIHMLSQLILVTDRTHIIIESNHPTWKQFDNFIGKSIMDLIEDLSPAEEMARFEGYLEQQLELQDSFMIDFSIDISEERKERHRFSAVPIIKNELFGGYMLCLYNIDASNQMLQAYYSKDAATDLFDRTFGERMIQGLIKRRVQTGSTFTVVGFEISGFLIIKDSYGRTVADSLIKQAADLVKNAVRHADTPYYVDDGQFNVICLSSNDMVKPMVERVIKKAQQTFVKEIASSLQFKVAMVSMDEITTQSQLIHLLDMRLKNS